MKSDICKKRIISVVSAVVIAVSSLLAGGFSVSAEGFSLRTYEAEDSVQTMIRAYSDKFFKNSEVLKSTYQDIQGYDWMDLYSIIMLILPGPGLKNGRTAVFSLVETASAANPLLVIGFASEDHNNDLYYVYTVDNGNVYELLKTDRRLYYNTVSDSLCTSNGSVNYVYRPHVLIKLTEKKDSHFVKPLKLNNLDEYVPTAEELPGYVESFRRK